MPFVFVKSIYNILKYNKKIDVNLLLILKNTLKVSL